MSERLVLGIQPVRELCRTPAAGSARVLLDRAGGPALGALARFAAGCGARVERIPRAELDRLASGVAHQGVAAWAPPLRVGSAQDVEPGRDAPLVVLDGITDPQNFGATIRSAVALGSGSVLWAEHASAPLSPATFRASAGAVEHARLLRARSLRAALSALGERGWLTVALQSDAPGELASVDLRGPVAIVVGAEHRGISRAVRRACRLEARLAMRGRLGSLNASVAAALALYEIRRQEAHRPAGLVP
ncbi:MAG: RNA methyltransferase [Deltaproteobacteria bacterium]|nr:RNA methyltransferase [Deltaproteobacteria bacterium]